MNNVLPINENRKKVYESFDSERDFQDLLEADPNRPDIIPDLHIGDTILAIQHNLNKAIDCWYGDSAPYTGTMIHLRKVGGLIVKLGEKYPMPKRATLPKI